MDYIKGSMINEGHEWESADEWEYQGELWV